MMQEAQADLVFHYDPATQRSPEWLERKRGKIGASELWRWMSVSKAKATPGAPLKARLDYEKELIFEQQFGVNFTKWVSGPMQEGNEFEDWARKQYEQIKGVVLHTCGVWYNAFMAVSPDSTAGEKGLVEIKIVKDSTFLEVLNSKKILEDNDQVAIEKTSTVHKHWKQMQAQLKATGREWVDYVVVNFNTKKIAIIRIRPCVEFQDYMMLAIQEKLVTAEFDTRTVFDVVGELPEGADGLSGILNQESEGTPEW